MSNKRRKTIGSTKVARNLAVRIRRGSEKAGTPLPGHSSVYKLTNLEESYRRRGEQLRENIERHTSSYWGDPARR